MHARDVREQAACAGAWARKAPMAKRAIGGYRHRVLFAPGDHSMFDAAFLKVIEDLIAGKAARASDCQDLLKIFDIKIADPPGEDFSLLLKCVEGRNGFPQRMRPAPVQKIAIEPVGPQVFERFLTGCPRARSRGVLRKHF